MSGVARLVEVNGTRLFVDVRGSEDAPTLLYIHGGPGMGSYDFMSAVGDRLVERGLRVVGLDQRGVLRSDPLPGEPPLSVEVLVSDFEAVRSALRIERWSILAHSAGAVYGLEYAVSHPDAVTVAVFDCPSWDADLTDRYRLPIAAQRLEDRGEQEAAARCRDLAAKPDRIDASDDTRSTMQQLGPDYLSLFFHDASNAGIIEQASEVSGLSDAQWSKGISHLPLLAEMYQPRLGMLAELRPPALLVHGRDDLVTAPEMLRRFRDDVSDGVVHEFPRSGHFAYHEEPDEYVEVLADFIHAHSA
ncbi:MAG: alpha/beta fold hydrolase [Nocardioidaceae bacterium]